MPGGLEIWRGYFQSVRPGIERLTINVDITSAVMFQAGPLLALCLKFLNRGDNPSLLDPRRGLPDRERIRLQRFLAGLRILVKRAGATTERPMVRSIRKLSSAGADNLTFTTREGVSLTVAEHFRRNGEQLKYPSLICVEVSVFHSLGPCVDICSDRFGCPDTRRDVHCSQGADHAKTVAAGEDQRRRRVLNEEAG